jgi:hypothetical protein
MAQTGRSNVRYVDPQRRYTAVLGPSWNAPFEALPHDDRAGTHDSADGRCGSYASIGRGQASTKIFRRYPQSALCSKNPARAPLVTGHPRPSRARGRGRLFRTTSTREADCVPGHVGLELRNVVANYPFERSHRFPGIKPNSGHRDYSPLSCGGGETQLGPSAEISAGFLERGARSLRRIAAIAKNFCRSRDDPAGQLGNTIAHFALDFSRQESVCGGHGQRACGLLLSPASALRPPRGLGGGGAILRRHDGEEFLHVQAQAWANYQEGFI